MGDSTILQENTHLAYTLEKLKQAKHTLEDSMNIMGVENLEKLRDLRENPETSGDDFHFFMEQLHEKNIAFNFKDKYKRLEEIDTSLSEPYFSRIDLVNTATNETRKVYIGKFGYTENEPVKTIITDWRAKIASVYYRYRYPQKAVKYTAPEGIKTRDLVLKRTFEIDNGELLKYYNNDIQLDENEIIVDKIEQRTGGVLEDIVETIQESQLDIIESDPRQVCIVQGCVGSGKSTVAIHKLSHIFFNYPKLIEPSRAILIAKNQILVGYLSTLFPKLGIFDINYKTLRDLIFNLVFREDLKIKIDFSMPSHKEHLNIAQIKSLMKTIETIHHEYEQKLKKILLQEDFKAFASETYVRTNTVHENITDVITDLAEELQLQKDFLKENPNSTKDWLYKSNIKDLQNLITKLKRLRKDILEKTLPQLIKTLGLDTTEKMGYVDTLLYVLIYAELVGFRKVQKYNYCVVDEAQDFSVLEYLVLGNFVLNGRFCFLGDLNQGYQKEGLTSWEQITDVITDAHHAVTFELTTNYRSTKPIIDMANQILAPYTDKYLPESINRKGNQPQINTLTTYNDMIRAFTQELTQDIRNLNKSIGIICLEQRTFEQIEKILAKLDIPKDKFIVLDAQKPISYIPRGVYLTTFEDCKGLEFAKVYVLDLNLENIHSFTDAKKAFVAVTRAMNELSIYSVI